MNKYSRESWWAASGIYHFVACAFCYAFAYSLLLKGRKGSRAARRFFEAVHVPRNRQGRAQEYASWPQDFQEAVRVVDMLRRGVCVPRVTEQLPKTSGLVGDIWSVSEEEGATHVTCTGRQNQPCRKLQFLATLAGACPHFIDTGEPGGA